MNTEKILPNAREKYIPPVCDIIEVDIESVMVKGSGNLPGGSQGHDMGGGGSEDDPITLSKKRIAGWDSWKSDDDSTK